MSIASEILSGKHDNELDVIDTALRARRKQVGNSAFQVGDLVEFINGRPKYLHGLRGRVVDILNTNVRVQVIDEHKARAGRFGYGPFASPPSLLKKVG